MSIEVNYGKHSFRMQPSCLDRVPPCFQSQYVPDLGLSELHFTEVKTLSIHLNHKVQHLFVIACWISFEFQTKINFYSCYVVVHLNIFKLLLAVKLCVVMLPISLPAAILWTEWPFASSSFIFHFQHFPSVLLVPLCSSTTAHKNIAVIQVLQFEQKWVLWS